MECDGKRKIIVFGSISITTRCLRYILSLPNTDVLGVCCIQLNDTWRKKDENDFTYDFCKAKKIKVLNLEDVLSLDPDLGISICYHKIITKEILEHFPMGVVNAHGGILPGYGGYHPNIYSIINGEKEFGVTLHYMDEGVDSGDIIACLRAPIQEGDTGYTLLKKSEEMLFNVVTENVINVLDGVSKRTPQKDIGVTPCIHKKSDITKLFYIPAENLNSVEAVRLIRALDSPIHEGAYTIIQGTKIFLKYAVTEN